MATADQGEMSRVLEELNRLGQQLERLTGVPAGGPRTDGGQAPGRAPHTLEEFLVGITERLEQLASQTEERGRRVEERLERIEKRLSELAKQGGLP